MRDNSIQNIRQNAVSELVRSGISCNEASVEVDILIEYVFNLKKKDILTNPDIILDQSKIERFQSLIQTRIREKIPVQYLTNTAYFMGYEFYVNKDVLIPRPETEILVENVLKIIQNSNLDNEEFSLIDVGTGSGCIACTLAKLTNNIKIFASDISENALKVAQINAKNLVIKDKISFKKSDIFANIEDKFNVIVSNPPYISITERENLQFEVSEHEPQLALFVNDKQGISFYEKLINQSKEKLKANGFLAVEIGINQAPYIKELFVKSDFENIQIIKDYNNIERIIIAQSFA